MPKEALVKTLEKLLEPVSGKSVYLTANDLLAVWDFFDIDHDGVLLAEEYELFVRILGEILKTVFPNYGRTLLPDLITAAINPGLPYQIGIDEISHLLNEEERFLLVFRKLSNIQSSFDFMKVWREFDTDGNGILDRKELQTFLSKLLSKSTVPVTHEKIEEFASLILKFFDVNSDGQLQICEMSKLLPTKNNILANTTLKEISEAELDRIFDFYDQDHSGVIENEEFEGLVKDLLDSAKKNYDTKELDEFKDILLKQWDENSDGKISKSELKLLLLHSRSM
uniref:Calbindin 32 n=1 Tax=Echinococcus granulosus TaxID=6210 RepID=A0A068WGY1_ECHGR|nr:calbindin 32 [Echinococcus granulosus]